MSCCVLLNSPPRFRVASIFAASSPIVGSYTNQHYRFEYDRSCLNGDEKMWKNKYPITMIKLEKKRKLGFCPQASSAVATTRSSSSPSLYQEVLEAARKKFTREISFQSKDKDISLAKALLYIAAEDEALIALNREIDARSLQSERRNTSNLSTCQNWDSIDTMPLAGKKISEWLKELETIAEEVKAELTSREIGCHLGEVLEAVNLILFEIRGFRRPSVLVDPKDSYLNSVLNSGCGSAILLSVIYIEVCRRLNLTILGSRVGEEFLIWPQTGNPEELFKVTSGHSLFGLVNGSCVDNPRSKASDLSSKSLSGLDIATNRDIIGISLANLIISESPRSVNLKIIEGPKALILKYDPKPVLHYRTPNKYLGTNTCSEKYITNCHESSFTRLDPNNSSLMSQRLHWKRASRSNHGLMLTSPLRPIHDANDNFSLNSSKVPLVRPQDLRLAIMASERLLILQPHNWALRRDHGMMLYYSREYEAAVQELSICMAFAPEEEAAILEPFVEKLHLLRVESSWTSLGHKGPLTVT